MVQWNVQVFSDPQIPQHSAVESKHKIFKKKISRLSSVTFSTFTDKHCELVSKYTPTKPMHCTLLQTSFSVTHSHQERAANHTRLINWLWFKVYVTNIHDYWNLLHVNYRGKRPLTHFISLDKYLLHVLQQEHTWCDFIRTSYCTTPAITGRK